MSDAVAWTEAALPSPVRMEGVVERTRANAINEALGSATPAHDPAQRDDEAEVESLRFSAVIGEIYAMADQCDGLARATRAIAVLLAADRAELLYGNLESGACQQEIVLRRTSTSQSLEATIRGGARPLRLRVERQRHWPRFDEGETRSVRMLVPHLKRAIELREQLALQRSSSIEFELELLSKLGVAVAVVDESLSLICSNERARQVVTAADGLLVEKQCVFASSPASTMRLRNAVQNVINEGANLSTVVIERMIAGTPLHVTVVAAPTEHRVLLVIAGGGQPPAQMPRILAEAYGLSPAEGRLVQLLIEGSSAIEAASLLGVSPNTARTQLKSVLRKTTTRRQSELVSVLLRGALRFT